MIYHGATATIAHNIAPAYLVLSIILGIEYVKHVLGGTIILLMIFDIGDKSKAEELWATLRFLGSCSSDWYIYFNHLFYLTKKEVNKLLPFHDWALNE